MLSLSLDTMMATTITHPAAAVLKHGRHLLRRLVVSSPAILHAAWITALLAVCLALCIIHSRKPPSSSSSKAARRERGASSSSTRRRSGPGDEGSSGGGGGVGGSIKAAAAAATPPAKVSPTPSDAAKANGRVGETHAAAAEGRVQGSGSAAVPVTVIDVGTHGPIAPAFPAPDPLPPRRSLSVKHMRLAERLGARIRSTRWGRDDHDDDDDDAGGGGDPAAAAEGSATLWTKTIILGERCRVGDDDEDGDGDAVVRWKSYRPRQPRSVPMTRSNSFAGVGSLQLQGGGASRPPADVPFHLGRRASLPAKDEM